jgi:hypothetical protein
MQVACDAAALAGVVELLDQAPLYLGGLQAQSSSTASPELGRLVDRERVASARTQAQAYAANNAVGSRPLQLDANQTNRPDGDLVVGWVDEPQSRGCPMNVWSDDGPINSLLVRGNCRERRGNAVTLWIGRLFGLSGVDLAASARATIDYRIYGFRPNGHVPVPLIPIVIHPSRDSRDALDVIGVVRPASSPSDVYSVDDRTGAVAFGADGIDEIVLTIPGGRSSGELANASLVDFQFGAPNNLTDLERCIERGYNSSDLQTLGGELAFGNGPLELPIIELALDVPAPSVAKSLLAVRGEKRIWLLGDRPNELGHCNLSGFVAGRVVSCSQTADAGLEVVVQPCVLATCTALVGADWPRNLWIGKAMLSE